MAVPDSVYLFLYLLSIFIAAIAIIGNMLVCYVIVRLKTMKTAINYIILNLAILDTISGVITIYCTFLNDKRSVLLGPVLKRAYNQSSILADVLCNFEALYWLPASVSPMLLMIMAYERYKAIVDPLSRVDSTVTKARLKWMIPLAWITGIPFNIVNVTMVTYNDSQGYCNYKWHNFEYYITLWLITQVVIPSIAMLVFYARVICHLRKQDNALGSQAEAERVRRKATRNVMRTIISVTVVFYLFAEIPHFFCIVYTAFHPIDIKSSILGDIILVILAVNLAFNPCAYFAFIQSFRDGFRRVFCHKTREPQPASGCCNAVVVEDRQKSVPKLLTFNLEQSNGDEKK